MLIGYARVSPERQNLAAQLKGLADLGVAAERIYTDKRIGRSMKDRPGLAQAIVALRLGDVLVVTKLDGLWPDRCPTPATLSSTPSAPGGGAKRPDGR